MTATPAYPPFPIARAAACVTAAAVLGGLVALAGVSLVGEVDSAMGSAVFAATSFVWLLGVMALMLVAAAAPRGPHTVAMTHLAGTGLRLLLGAVLAVLAVKQWGWPTLAVGLALPGAYLFTVLAEAVCVGQYVRAAWPDAPEPSETAA